MAIAAAMASILLLGDAVMGYGATYSVAFGAFSMMALAIGATFFWLWRARSTPLALGMAFSWAGSACVMGWWWIYTLTGEPPAMRTNTLLFVFLALSLTGALMHFAVIRRSLGWDGAIWLVPLGALAASAALVLAA
ncbi:hypothetical protein OCGS_2418 [Oceaniovalibus guishaninsula JLT2003]|uniref:Uncharacterized protein n=1 Tax=Oceaniovalibus guishaninsula JLT2003 TaxID=1231392 RepID=K2GLW1_9RHOB|nr:hypothetical protein OCGS_2418 [Oceaniovalibus guishaninsula JLT2003]